MSTKHEGLPVAGYKPQDAEKVALVNRNKELEERVLRVLDELRRRTFREDASFVDLNWLQDGRRQIELGFMAVNRAIFRPGRVALPEDAADGS